MTPRMSPGLAVLFALVVPYLGLLLLIAAGMLRPGQRTSEPSDWPSVDVVVPAHNEAEVLPATLAALRRLDYPGRLRVYVVDDRSTDGTAAVVLQAAAADPRVHLVQVQAPARRLAPKVNAVAGGLRAGHGDVVLTTDADCLVEPGWAEAMVAPFDDPRVVLAHGSVTTRAPGVARGFRERFEAIDWLSLMLVSRSLARFGWSLTSTANAQAFRRAAFQRVGGFGLAGRAPSGDEDLLAQRLGRLHGARTVFVDHPAARVVTRPMPSWAALLRQRRRWVSRYQHADAYHPWFWSAIVLLGAQSIALSSAVITLPFVPATAAGAVLGLWGSKLAVEVVGMHAGLRALGRPDLGGAAVLGWAVLHPFFIATVVLASLWRPASWRSAEGYRRRLWRARWRRWRRHWGRRWHSARRGWRRQGARGLGSDS